MGSEMCIRDRRERERERERLLSTVKVVLERKTVSLKNDPCVWEWYCLKLCLLRKLLSNCLRVSQYGVTLVKYIFPYLEET